MVKTSVGDRLLAWSQLRNMAGRGLEMALDIIFPRHCLMCGMPSGDKNLCSPCRDDLPWPGHNCSRCGLPLPGYGDEACGRCLEKPPPWDRVFAVLDYRFPVDVLIRRFKFNRNMAAGAVLSEELVRAVRNSGQAHSPPDALVPVPLHRTRHLTRTFNQSDLIARNLAKEIDIPLMNALLRRTRRTSAQSGLDAKSRLRNTRGAFHCQSRYAEGLRHVALVDDVMTTGATLHACTLELKRAGINEVSIWIVARAPPP